MRKIYKCVKWGLDPHNDQSFAGLEPICKNYRNFSEIFKYI